MSNNDNTWTEIRTTVLSESIVRAREAIAFLQMGQQEPISVVIEDDLIQVTLDHEKLTFPFDPSEAMERDVYVESEATPKWTTTPIWLYLHMVVPEMDEQATYHDLSDEIDAAFAAIDAYAYDAAVGAVNYLTKKEN